MMMLQENRALSPKHSRLSPHRIENLFLLNGITSLLGWNALLTSLDYFHYVYQDYDVALYFPIPCFIAYALTGVSFNWIDKKFRYSDLVSKGIVCTNISLAAMLLTSLFTSHSAVIGFWLCMILSFLVGLFSNVAQLSFLGMMNCFGGHTVSRFTIGTATGGLSLTLLRIITIGIFGSNEGNIIPIILYFTLTISFNFFDLFLNLKLFKSSLYKQKISDTQEKEINDFLRERAEGKKFIQEVSQFITLLTGTMKTVFPYPAFIFFNYVVTFVLFPDLSLSKKTTIPQVWTIMLFLVMFNLGDFMGKIAADFRRSFNSYSITFLFFGRLFFIYSIIAMDSSFSQEDHILNNNFFPFLNLFLFAFTNGLVTNACFILSFEHATDQFKRYAGVLGGISLQFGIMLGTFLAIPIERAVEPV